MLSTEMPLLRMDFSVVINKTLLLAESTNTMTNATSIGEVANNAGRLAFEAFNGNWLELANGKSHIYEATVKVSLGLAAIIIAFWAIPFFNTIMSEGYSQKTIEELVYPLLVVFMLAIGNGSLLSSTSFLFRNTANYVNNRILETTINGIKIEQAIRQSNLNQAFKQMLNEKVEECHLLPSSEKNQNGVNVQTACIKNAIDEVIKSAKDYEAKNKASGFNLNFLDNLKNSLQSGVEGITKIPAQFTNSYVQGELLVILPTFAVGFTFLVEIASLINAYIAPIFVALSLFPGHVKLIHVWLSGWLGLGLVKISYTIIIGIATSSIVNVEDTNPLLLPLLLGVLSPILALAIASGGGMALFNALSSSAASGLRLLIKSGLSVGAKSTPAVRNRGR